MIIGSLSNPPFDDFARPDVPEPWYQWDHKTESNDLLEGPVSLTTLTRLKSIQEPEALRFWSREAYPDRLVESASGFRKRFHTLNAISWSAGDD